MGHPFPSISLQEDCFLLLFLGHNMQQVYEYVHLFNILIRFTN